MSLCRSQRLDKKQVGSRTPESAVGKSPKGKGREILLQKIQANSQTSSKKQSTKVGEGSEESSKISDVYESLHTQSGSIDSNSKLLAFGEDVS
ncbi:hypothetical protein O181_000182 [Austropuccinia psidii MF-1]|uniref:Uncharacterized protein n=1 Tax=Austropuccinia psidii MF-1 TaxID=1389203 RepID=A0A9Q3GBS7_9BASI|nr:hypothetical protein [Austropuccinia psidii MF-1]